MRTYRYLLVAALLLTGCKLRVLVLQDSYQSQFAWTTQDERFNRYRDEANEFKVRAIWKWEDRFRIYMGGDPRIEFEKLNLETHKGELPLRADLVVIDDVRSYVLAPRAAELVKYVKGGGGLIIAAGFYGLGGRALNEGNNDLSVLTEVSDYRKTALAEILPVKITESPDYLYKFTKPLSLRVDEKFFAGIPMTPPWVKSYHKVALAEGAVSLAEVEAGVPLVAYKDIGKGRVVVVNFGELEFAHQGGEPFRYAGLLYERLGALALKQPVAVRELSPEKPAYATDEDIVIHEKAHGDLLEPRVLLTNDADVQSDITRSVHWEATAAGSVLRLGALFMPVGHYRLLVVSKTRGGIPSVSACEFDRVLPQGLKIEFKTPDAVLRGKTAEIRARVTAETPLKEPEIVLHLRRRGAPRPLISVASPLDKDQSAVFELQTARLGKGGYYLSVQLPDERKDETARLLSGPTVSHEFWVAEPEPYFQGFLWVGEPTCELEWQDYLAHHIGVLTGSANMLKHGGFWVGRQIGMHEMAARDPALATLAPKARAKVTEELSAVGVDGKVLTGTFCLNKPAFYEHAEAGLRAVLPEVFPYPEASLIDLEDEWQHPLCYCPTCKELFRKQYGYEMPLPRADTSPEYLAKWHDRITFYLDTRRDYITRSTELIHKVTQKPASGTPTGPLVTTSHPQGFSAYFGQEVTRINWGGDLPWDHTYPGDMPMLTAMAAQSLDEAVRLSPRPDRPQFFLLQGFAYPARFPSMPPREYTRLQGWLAFSHGTTGIGWFCYQWMRWVMPGSGAWEGVKDTNDIMELYAPTFTQLQPKRQPIALLYNLSSESADVLRLLVRIEDHPWNPPNEGTSWLILWRTYHALQEAYLAMKFAHIPFDCIFEEHVNRGQLPYKAILIPNGTFIHPRMAAGLKKYMDGGGKVFLGSTTSFELPGAVKTDIDFEEMLRTMFPPGKPGETNWRRHRCFYIDSIFAKSQKLKLLLAPYHDSPVEIEGSPEVVWSIRSGGEDIDYLFLVNHTAHQPSPTPDEFEKWRKFTVGFTIWPIEFLSAQVRVSVKSEAEIVDGLTGERVKTKSRTVYTSRGPEHRQEFPVKFEPGDGRILALFKTPVGKVNLKVRPVVWTPRVRAFSEVLEELPEAKELVRGGTIELTITIERSKGEGTAFRGALPLAVRLSHGERFQDFYRSTRRDGTARLVLPLDYDFPAGELRIGVLEPLSGKTAETCVTVVEGEPPLR